MTSWKGKRTLVTGGAGFIGSHVVDALLERGSRVTVVDNLSTGRGENVDTGKVRFVKADLNRIKNFKELLEGTDIIIHLAASADVPTANRDPLADFATNAEASLVLLENVRKFAPDATVFYGSTVMVHGECEKERIDEDTQIEPVSFYGLSKYTGEHYSILYSGVYGLNVKIARYFNIYGPRYHSHVVFDILTKIAKDPKHLELFGTGEEARDFMFVRDAASATLRFLEVEDAPKIINMGTGSSISIKELVAEILCLCNIKDCQVSFSQRSWKGDVKKYRANVSRLKALGFEPQYSLTQGLTETIRWFEKTYAKKVIR